MRFCSNCRLQLKLMFVILFASLVTLLLALGGAVVLQWFHAETSIIDDLRTQAQIIAANSTAALSFDDAKVAEENLSALKAKEHLLSAALYLRNGRLLAGVQLTPAAPQIPAQPQADGLLLQGALLELWQPILQGHRRVGSLYLLYNYRALQYELLRQHFMVLLLIAPASILLALLLATLLQRVISIPILKLAAVARRVGEQNDYTVRAEPGGRDEVGLLTRAFNQMLDEIQKNAAALRQMNLKLSNEIAERQRAETELEQMHQAMLEVSRQAGMAEVATGVLHNVGNVLNSVNVSCTLALDRLREVKCANLAKLATVLAAPPGDPADFLAHDPKGSQIPAYLASLAQQLEENQTLALREIESLRAHIDHIKDIVAMQQNFARAAGVVERVQAEDLVEDALKLNANLLARHAVRVSRDYAPTPALEIDKHKALQILVNLIRNAQEALDPCDPTARRLVCRTSLNGDQRVLIRICDNGVGIAPELLTRIFGHGFTTRKHGHGFGLHSGALAARELGGSLHAHSDGLQQGATFTLELPLTPNNNHATRTH